MQRCHFIFPNKKVCNTNTEEMNTVNPFLKHSFWSQHHGRRAQQFIELVPLRSIPLSLSSQSALANSRMKKTTTSPSTCRTNSTWKINLETTQSSQLNHQDSKCTCCLFTSTSVAFDAFPSTHSTIETSTNVWNSVP